MKKKIFYTGFSIFVVVLVITCMGMFYNQENKVLTNWHDSRQNFENALSVMYETEEDSGIYQESTNSSFAPSDYRFNSV